MIAGGPGEVLAELAPLLPPQVRSNPDYAAIEAYFRELSADTAAYSHYIEWNLRSAQLDPSFTFPTHIDGIIRVAVEDLLEDLTRGLSADERRGQGRAAHLLGALRSMEVSDPLFPRAISLSVERLGDRAGGHRRADMGFVIADFGPELEPSSLGRALALVAPVTDLPSRAALERFAVGLRVAHVGSGWRNGRERHKVYLRGELAELVEASARDDGAALLTTHRGALETLAREGAGRMAHLVVDVEDGRARRIGFELNFPGEAAAARDYAELVQRQPLWRHHVSDADAGAVATQLAARDWRRVLPSGETAELELCHLKVSFDGDRGPEWKAYLRLIRS